MTYEVHRSEYISTAHDESLDQFDMVLLNVDGAKSLLLEKRCGAQRSLDLNDLDAVLFADLAQAIHDQEAAEPLPLQIASNDAPEEARRNVVRGNGIASARDDVAVMFHDEVRGFGPIEERRELVAIQRCQGRRMRSENGRDREERSEAL